MIGSAITRVFAVGVLPFALASLVCLAAREILLWPLFEAKLWARRRAFFSPGSATGSPSGSLRQATASRPRGWPLPHEASLAPYAFNLSRDGGLHTGPVLGGAFLQSVALLWRRGARRVSRLRGVLVDLVRGQEPVPRRSPRVERAGTRPRGEEARAKNCGGEGATTFLWRPLAPFGDAPSHFLVTGATNTGKTIIQRMLMQSALRGIYLGQDQRAVVFNAKQDVLSILAGMNLDCPIITLDPFDARLCLGHGGGYHDQNRCRGLGGEPRANR